MAARDGEGALTPHPSLFLPQPQDLRGPEISFNVVGPCFHLDGFCRLLPRALAGLLRGCRKALEGKATGFQILFRVWAAQYHPGGRVRWLVRG